MAGRTSLFQTHELADGRMNDTFGEELLVAVDAGLVLIGSCSRGWPDDAEKKKSEGQEGAAKNGDTADFTHHHAPFYRIRKKNQQQNRSKKALDQGNRHATGCRDAFAEQVNSVSHCTAEESCKVKKKIRIRQQKSGAWTFEAATRLMRKA